MLVHELLENDDWENISSKISLMNRLRQHEATIEKQQEFVDLQLINLLDKRAIVTEPEKGLLGITFDNYGFKITRSAPQGSEYTDTAYIVKGKDTEKVKRLMMHLQKKWNKLNNEMHYINRQKSDLTNRVEVK